jgi:hypothetical protein
MIVFALGSTGVMAGGEVNLLYGQKNLDLGWPPLPSDIPELFGREWNSMVNDLEDQTLWGILFTWGHDWPVALAVDYIDGSSDSSFYYYYRVNTEVTTQEVDLGVRKFFGDTFQGYVGGGAAIIRGENQVTLRDPGGQAIPGLSGSASDTGIGFFIDAGFVWRAGRWFNLGLDLRYSDASADLLVPNWDANSKAEFLRTGSTDVGGFGGGIFIGGRF